MNSDGMSGPEQAFHYVCTLDEAREMVESRDRFWISNCECREKRGPCQRSGIFLCLQFQEKTAAVGTGKRPASRDEVLAVLSEARETHLVPRPFRDEEDRAKTVGICFCCDCCCDYFVASPEERQCDKGSYIEQTDADLCTACGTCEEVCLWGARVVDGDELSVNRDECYGCGVCVEVCPDECIQMVLRE